MHQEIQEKEGLLENQYVLLFWMNVDTQSGLQQEIKCNSDSSRDFNKRTFSKLWAEEADLNTESHGDKAQWGAVTTTTIVPIFRAR